MKIIDIERDKGKIKIRIDSDEDLFYLDRFLIKGDLVGSQTDRRLETREDMIRPGDTPRVKIYLVIKIEDTEFHPFADILRLKGTIVKGPTDMSGYHTFNIDRGDVIDIKKEQLREVEINILIKAEESSERPRALIISMDDEDAYIFRMREFGPHSAGHIKAGSGGKDYQGNSKWDNYYDDVTRSILTIHTGKEPILIIGPGFFKEVLAKHLRESKIGSDVTIDVLSASAAGLPGLNEVLSRSDGIEDIISKARFIKESKFVGELMERIGKGKGATFGKKEVSRALDYGAVETLLVSDDIYRTEEGRKLVERTSDMGSDFLIVSSHHEKGRMFNKMGGLGAFLRFEV